MAEYEVIVSNVGTIYSGIDSATAEKDYAECVCLSKANYGRFAGESVAMFCDGEIIMEYVGELDNG